MIPNKVIMLAYTCTTVGAVIAAGYSAKKCNELEESLSATRTAVANGVNIDIPQVIFEEAIHQAIDSSVDAYSRTVSSRISSENLQNVSKIYQSIADSMKPVKDNAIKISV